MIKDSITQGASAVLEYENPGVTEGAISGLNGLALGMNVLSVQRVPYQMASLLLTPVATAAITTTQNSSNTSFANVGSKDHILISMPATCVLRLSNMTTVEDLQDDELYEELSEDVSEECNTHGTVLSIVIPRPSSNDTARGVGHVFVKFTSPEGATRAKKAIHGRSFNGAKVEVVFYPVTLFDDQVRG